MKITIRFSIISILLRVRDGKMFIQDKEFDQENQLESSMRMHKLTECNENKAKMPLSLNLPNRKRSN